MKPLPQNPKVVFFGNTKYSVIVAKALQRKIGLSAVVTITDKFAGRKRQLTPSPVKKFAIENNIPILTTDKLNQKTIDEISNLKSDFLVISDYGQILPGQLLKIPKYAALNVHHSLLPKYRGPSPAPAAILAGEEKSGVTIISITEKVDAGDILIQQEYQLTKDETTDSLLTKLNTLGSQLVIDVIEKYLSGSVKPQTQNEARTTYTHRFKKQDGFIDPENPPDPLTFDRMVRAYYPWPGVWTKIKWKVGPVLDRVETRSGSGKWKVLKVKFLPENLIQPEGKKPMSIKEFLNGYPKVKGLIEKLKT